MGQCLTRLNREGTLALHLSHCARLNISVPLETGWATSSLSFNAARFLSQGHTSHGPCGSFQSSTPEHFFEHLFHTREKTCFPQGSVWADLPKARTNEDQTRGQSWCFSLTY